MAFCTTVLYGPSKGVVQRVRFLYSPAAAPCRPGRANRTSMTNENSVSGLAPSTEQCWLAVERAAASPSLKRAARLRAFLLYIGDQSVHHGRTELHEQELGETVFARPRGYDTTQDNIVRVSATELRKRIETHFAAEGKDEPVVFDIPRGGYVPVFRWRTLPVVAVLAAGKDIAAPPKAANWERRLLWGVSTIALALAVLCLLLWQSNRDLQRRITEPAATQSR